MYRTLVESIKASVLTAFYTPQFIVEAVARQIHDTFQQNGLQMRSLLEPSAGIGGFLPVAMSDTHSYAFEKDCITGLILSFLHDDTDTVTAGFETIGEQDFEHSKFDVIVSNIPFGNFKVFDADLWKKGGIYEQATKTIHNYFFIKAMDLLNEGGLLAFITSRGVADTPGQQVRARIPREPRRFDKCRPYAGHPFHADKRYRGRQRLTRVPEAHEQGGTFAA